MSAHQDKQADATAGSGGSDLAEALLHQPVATDDRPDRRWAYPLWGIVLVSCFVAYHAAMLLVHNLPGGGLSKGIHTFFHKHFKMNDYMRATGNTQSWAMFAPNPHRSNIFMKVLVKDQEGEVWDLAHDIYGRRTYPYLFYDRMGKINRRIVDQKGYRRHYAAWVCREWERTHGGEPAVEVQFVKMWTRIPPPEKVYKYMWYDPMKLHLHQREEDVIRCKHTRHAQLPNYLRERMGLPLVDDHVFRDVTMRTWWERKQARQAAEVRAERRDEDEDAPAGAGEGEVE